MLLGGGEVVLHGAHVVEAVAPCHGRSIDLALSPLSVTAHTPPSDEFVREEVDRRKREIEGKLLLVLGTGRATTLCSSPPYGAKAKAQLIPG
jgi:hypothetical protein